MSNAKDFATGKPIKVGNPEEIIRQEYEQVLIDDYGYKKEEIDIEVPITRGTRTRDRADIVIYNSSSGRDPVADILGIVEVKSPGNTDGKAQLKSYMTATSAIWGVWTNGENIEYYCKPLGQSAVFEDYLNNIPSRGQRVEDVGKFSKDELKPYGAVELKVVFRRILNTLYANTNISRREKLGNEMIKLIFAKIKDETTYPDRAPDFRVRFKENPEAVKERISKLFKEVVNDLAHDGVFDANDKITLDAKGVALVVGQLERGSLVETPTDVVGDAFEVFAESKLVGEKGEFFTPRGVIDLAIKLTDPRPRQTVLDPACGSGGFLIAAMRHMWVVMENSSEWRNLPDQHLKEAKQNMALRCFFGIDKESDLVRIAKAYMAISGDGRSNIVHENSLHLTADFSEIAKAKFVCEERLRKFDIILTNPPYGTKTKVSEADSKNFDLGHRWAHKKGMWIKGKPKKTDPYILFIERCLEMLKQDGYLAIVLPETVFHASSTTYLRKYIMDLSSVEAVIDLPHNTFRPHCNAKTCLLVIKKGGRQGDIVMATPKEMGHNHQGKEIYQPGTDVIWDDLPAVLSELADPTNTSNSFVFMVKPSEVDRAGHLVPRYYFDRRISISPPQDTKWISLGNLIDRGIIKAWDGHGSPPSPAKGTGIIPYIRVKDIVNWELYRDPNSGIDNATYENYTKNKNKVRAGDVIFVKRGSYRIGTVAMVSDRDEKDGVMLTRELVTFRVQENEMGFTSYYLISLLSSEIVQSQIPALTFIDTTLPNIDKRWREILLPVHIERDKICELSDSIKDAIEMKWAAQRAIQDLRGELGDITT